MKRIAIQYSGLTNNILDCFNNNYENLILKNPEYEVDIFFHLWAPPEEEKYKISKIIEIIKPKDVFFEEPKNLKTYEFEKANEGWFLNMISMFYGIEKVNDMRVDYQKNNNIEYDYVIRSRADIIFLPNSIKPINQYEPEFIHTREGFLFEEYGINDYFAIGPPNLMDIYCSIYSNLEKAICDGSSIIPECLIGFNIKDLPIKKQKFRMWPWKYILSTLDPIKHMNLG